MSASVPPEREPYSSARPYNVLTGIVGFADLTAPLVPAGSQPAKFVAEIAKAGQRGMALTHQLHQLSRGATPRPSPGTVAAAFAKESSRLAAANVEVRADLPPDHAPNGQIFGTLSAFCRAEKRIFCDCTSAGRGAARTR